MSREQVRAENYSVLVVEDDEILRTFFCTLLEREGFTVEPAGDGAEALVCLGRREFDVVLLDLLMPVTDGFEVLARLERVAPQVVRRVVITTGVIPSRMQGVDRKKVFAVLQKPFDVTDLVESVSSCAERARRASLEGESQPAAERLKAAVPDLKRLLRMRGGSDDQVMVQAQFRAALGEMRSAARATRREEQPRRAAEYVDPSPFGRREH